MIYLDYNATTPVAEEVLSAMLPYLTQEFGNPSNTYGLGQTAKQAIVKARTQVAKLIHSKAEEVMFTGSGSEANNMVLKGIALANLDKGKHIISTTIEHPSVIEPLEFLKRFGFRITYLSVDKNGKINIDELAHAIDQETILVSVMHANNEVGTLQPIKEIGEICRKHKVLFHSDASQSVGKVPIDVQALQVDFLTIAGHKLYAPKGIGALFVKEGRKVEPFIHGAAQENGRRAGTENTPYIVGLGVAAALAESKMNENELLDTRNYLHSQLVKTFGKLVKVNGDLRQSLPNTLNVSFVGYNGADLLASLPNIAASTGSACHSGDTVISPVLKAMGVEPAVASGAIRFSVGRFTTRKEIDAAIASLKTNILNERF